MTSQPAGLNQVEAWHSASTHLQPRRVWESIFWGVLPSSCRRVHHLPSWAGRDFLHPRGWAAAFWFHRAGLRGHSTSSSAPALALRLTSCGPNPTPASFLYTQHRDNTYYLLAQIILIKNWILRIECSRPLPSRKQRLRQIISRAHVFNFIENGHASLVFRFCTHRITLHVSLCYCEKNFPSVPTPHQSWIVNRSSAGL